MIARRTAAIVMMAAALFVSALGSVGVTAQSVTTPGCPGTSIRAPFASAVVSGTVEILGSARVEGFRFYKVEWAPAAEPESWRAVSQTIERSVSNGLLDRWDTRAIPDGRYRLKLTSVDERADERCRFVVEGLRVANAATPAPAESPISLPSPTALERARATDAPDPNPTPSEPAGETDVEEAEAVAEASPTAEDAGGGDEGADLESESGAESGTESEASAGDPAVADSDEASEPNVDSSGDPAASEADPGARFLRSMLGSFVFAFLATAVLAVIVLAYRARRRQENPS